MPNDPIDLLNKKAEYERKRVQAAKDVLDIEKQIEFQVRAINKYKKNLIDGDQEKLKIHQKQLEVLKEQKKQEEKLKKNKQSILDFQEKIHKESDKQKSLDYDIKSANERLLKIGKQVSAFKGKLSNTEKEILATNINNLKQNIKMAEVNQTNQQIADKLLGNLNLSVQSLKGMKDQAILFGRAIKANPMLLVAAAVAAVALGLIKMVNFGKRFRDELGTTLGQSKDLSVKLATTQGYLAAIGADSVKITGALTQNFGTLDAISATTVKRIGEFEKGLGIAPEHTAKIMKNMESIGGLTQDQALNQIKSVAALAKANDMIPNDIMADLADNTEFFASYAKDGGDNLAKAAMEARKLGLNLSTTAKIADSLLDFESSIEKEMEAALLTGKQLNYNRARALALEGDVAGAAKEVVKQVGGQAEFNKMNMVQRKALADSIGVSVEEMSKMTSGKPMELKKAKGDPLEGELNGLALATANNTTAIISATAAIIGLGAMQLFGGKGGGLKGLKSLFTKGGGKNAWNTFQKANKGLSPKDMSTAYQKSKSVVKGGGMFSKLMKGGNLLKAGGTAAKLAKGALGGIGGLVGGLALDYGRTKLDDKDSTLGKSMGIGSSTLAGASTGALIGSVIPGVGTAVGGAVGGAIGAAMGTWTEYGDQMKNWWKGKEKSGVDPNGAFKTNDQAAKVQTAAEFNQQRLDSMKSGDGRFSSVPLSVANRETTTQLQSEFGDLQSGQKSYLLQSIDDGSFEQKISGIIERMPEMVAIAMKNGPEAQQVAKETQEFIDVLKGIRENTGKTYTEIGNMIAD